MKQSNCCSEYEFTTLLRHFSDLMLKLLSQAMIQQINILCVVFCPPLVNVKIGIAEFNELTFIIHS